MINSHSVCISAINEEKIGKTETARIPTHTHTNAYAADCSWIAGLVYSRNPPYLLLLKINHKIPTQGTHVTP